MRNGLGHVRKLSGNRRKPYAAIVTTGYEYGEKQQDISFLKCILTDEEYNDLLNRYTTYCQSQKKSRQIQKYIGYYKTKKEGYLALSEYYQRPLDLSAQSLTFAEAWEYVKLGDYKDLSENTKRTYTMAYKKLSPFHKQKVKNITRFSLEKFLEENEDLSRAYQSAMVEVLHKVFAFCIKNKYISEDITIGISTKSKAKKRAKRAIPPEMIKTIYDNANNNYYALIYSVLIYTGMRVGELLALKKEDVHLSERYIALRGTKTASAERLVPIHKDIAPLLEKCLEGDSDYVIHSMRGGALHYRLLIKLLPDELKKIGLEYYTPHECRHTFSSLWTKNRLDETLRKKIIGHKANDLTIDTYTHVYIEDIVAEIDKLVVQ